MRSDILTSVRPLSACLALVLLASTPAARAADGHAMGGMGSMKHDGAHDRHMRLTPRWEARSGDAAKLAKVRDSMAKAIARYADVGAARRAGYAPFGDPPGPNGDDVHFVNIGRSILENWRLEPTKPGALLYRKRGGRYTLVGAMYVAPDDASLETLNERLPLSQTRWHLHTNICTPRPIWSRAGWARKHPSGKPLFGPESPISTNKACQDAGGKFHPSIFGWMAHVHLK